MAQCAADFYLEAKTLEFKTLAKSQGGKDVTEIDLAKITHRVVLEKLSRMVREK
jgi:hypothetical protein